MLNVISPVTALVCHAVPSPIKILPALGVVVPRDAPFIFETTGAPIFPVKSPASNEIALISVTVSNGEFASV